MVTVIVLGKQVKHRVMEQHEVISVSIIYEYMMEIFMNKIVQYNIPCVSTGTLSTVHTPMKCQQKYSERSVYIEGIHNYVLPTDSTVTGQSCHLCFLHGTDFRRLGVKLLCFIKLHL
jgi:hypothetical protein